MGYWQFVKTDFTSLNKIAAMPIYGKKNALKNLVLQNQENIEAESRYIALGS